MFKKLKPGETEEDVLRMAAEFNVERSKNPNFKAAATVVRIEKPPQKSLFAQKREKAKLQAKANVTEKLAEDDLKQNSAENDARNSETKRLETAMQKLDNKRNEETKVWTNVLSEDIQEKVMLDEIYENRNGSTSSKKLLETLKDDNTVHGKVDENYCTSSCSPITQSHDTCSVEQVPSVKPKSIFAQRMLGAKKQTLDTKPTSSTNTANPEGNITTGSFIVEDTKLSKELHAENLNLLSQMTKESILEERQKLMSSMDPALIAMLKQKRETRNAIISRTMSSAAPTEPKKEFTKDILESNSVQELLQQSSEGNWLNFNLIEEHKLAWMRDIPEKVAQLKPGQQYDARFDWKGVLLPHTLRLQPAKTDERELYLHGAEPDRPGYTLQELFRLARSTVLQQRVAAFGAISGIINIYNQGFYDNVFELPISKMLFLLRYGLDDNTHAQLEVVSKALACLCYNDTDEVILDFINENAYCHWQPTLQVVANASDETDPTSIAFLQRYMKLLRTNPKGVTADIYDEDDESRFNMDDFQLAETDVMDCLLRTNILQRICYILRDVRPENTTIESCLKLLIRLARTNVKIASELVEHGALLKVILKEFMPAILHIANDAEQPVYYGRPQYLCLKLFRVLICQHLTISKEIANTTLIERLKNYLFIREDMKGKMIRVQIEALRILRCLLLQGIVDRELFKQFLPALCQMLDWHYKNCVFDVGGSALIRQHASALLVAIAASGESGICDVEAQKLLMQALHDCCCSWLHKATCGEAPLKDYSQMTLLSDALYTMAWFARHSYDPAAFHKIQQSFLPRFVRSPAFIRCVQELTTSSIILRSSNDRRNVHPPLPNMGAVLMHDQGPQLVITHTYPVQLLSNIWALLELQLNNGEKALFDALVQPAVLEPISEYLKLLSTRLNRFLATNFFARSELKFIHQLLCTDGLETYFERGQLLQLVYNYLSCLSTAHATQIKDIFERYIFSDNYVQLDDKSLELLKQTCMEMVYPLLIEANKEPTLTLCYTLAPILPPDWPYFQLRMLLNNYLQNVQQQPANVFSEQQIVRMTLTFVQQLENQGLHIVTPLEKLMYLMIAFMGPDSQFLEASMNNLLRQHLLRFYEQNATHFFDFDANFVEKGNFEPLYYLFVNHFQAASYGDQLFSSLVLLPLAQKYDNKWRRRMWSEHVHVMRFVNCDESLLIGGLKAYMEPVEQEPSLLQLYGDALHRSLVRPGSIAYQIAKHHFNNSQVLRKTITFE